MKKEIPSTEELNKLVAIEVANYFSLLGRKGGKKSKRVLTPEQAKEMVRIREAKKSQTKGSTSKDK